MNTNEQTIAAATQDEAPISSELTIADRNQAEKEVFQVCNRIVCDGILAAKEDGLSPQTALIALLDTATFLAGVINTSVSKFAPEHAKATEEATITLFESALERIKNSVPPMCATYAMENNLRLDTPQYHKGTVFSDQAKFMQASGQSTGTLNLAQMDLYHTLTTEEFKELDHAVGAFKSQFAGMPDMPGYNAALGEVIKEACDVIVVVTGLLQSTGTDPQAAWNEVSGSNLSKIDPDTGKVLKREDGKVLKGPNYRKPDMAAVVETYRQD